MKSAGPPFSATTLLLSCALPAELRILKTQLRGPQRTLVTGLGAQRSAQRVSEVLRTDPPEALLFTGTCGLLDASLEIGEVAFPEQWSLQGGHGFPQSARLVRYLEGFGYRPRGSGVTVPSPVVTRPDRDRLSRRTGALVCDMESAAVLQAAAEAGVPALAFKIVSDSAQDNIPEYQRDFQANMALLAGYLQRLWSVLTGEGPASV